MSNGAKVVDIAGGCRQLGLAGPPPTRRKPRPWRADECELHNDCILCGRTSLFDLSQVTDNAGLLMSQRRSQAKTARPTKIAAIIKLDGKKNAPSADVVYRTLRERIIEGQLPAGSWLVEAELATQFRVSRTPVREALKRLIAERLAAHDAFRGTIVRSVDPREATEIGEMREVHEGLAARLAASRATDEQLNELDYIQAQLGLVLRNNRFAEAASHNARFHELLYSAAGNQRLAEVAGGLQDFVRRYTVEAISDPKRAAAIVLEHDEILKALRARNPAQAETAARAHCQACLFWSPSWAGNKTPI
jgi:DNA-binding GntR family transcriptional regulator